MAHLGSPGNLVLFSQQAYSWSNPHAQPTTATDKRPPRPNSASKCSNEGEMTPNVYQCRILSIRSQLIYVWSYSLRVVNHLISCLQVRFLEESRLKVQHNHNRDLLFISLTFIFAGHRDTRKIEHRETGRSKTAVETTTTACLFNYAICHSFGVFLFSFCSEYIAVQWIPWDHSLKKWLKSSIRSLVSGIILVDGNSIVYMQTPTFHCEEDTTKFLFRSHRRSCLQTSQKVCRFERKFCF